MNQSIWSKILINTVMRYVGNPTQIIRIRVILLVKWNSIFFLSLKHANYWSEKNTIRKTTLKIPFILTKRTLMLLLLAYFRFLLAIRWVILQVVMILSLPRIVYLKYVIKVSPYYYESSIYVKLLLLYVMYSGLRHNLPHLTIYF